MPELPEVENFALKLQELYGGSALRNVVFHRADIRFPLDKKSLGAILKPGVTLNRVGRSGKQLQFEFETGSVFFSLGMSGAFVPTIMGKPHKHEHLTLEFAGKESPVAFVDPRRFGFITPIAPRHAVDPLDHERLKLLFLQLKKMGTKRRLRDVMMDQKLIGGVGNIYACEACFLAGVYPAHPLFKVSARKLEALSHVLPDLLRLAIQKGGSSISTYRQFSGATGSFQDIHQVYGRAEEPCLKKSCKGKIERRVQAGRSYFYCPKCQK